MSHPITLTLFPAPCRWTSHGRILQIDAAKLLDRHDKPELWPASTSTDESSGLLPGWTFARFADDTRITGRDLVMASQQSARRVEAVHGLMLDYLDEPSVDDEHLRAWWKGTWFAAYTTSHHEQPQGERPQGPRWRVMIPFTRIATPEEAVKVAQWARHPRRGAGTVAVESEEVWRVAPLPAIGPGGYKWTWGSGTLLDPDACMVELEDWLRDDVERRAREELHGCLLEEATAAFLASRGERGPERFDWSGLHKDPIRLDGSIRPARPAEISLASLAPLGPLWPGRTAVLVGAGGSGRTALALQLAAAVAATGKPVLYVSLDVGVDELVARLIALRAEDDVAHRDVLLARHDEKALRAAIEGLKADLGSLHLWAPSHRERTPDALVERVQALRRASHGKPPLVVLDSVDDWEGTTESEALGSLFGALRDVARPGCLDPFWPGAAVLAVAGIGPRLAPAFASPRALIAALDGEVPLEVGPTREAALVLALASAPTPGPHPDAEALLVAAKNRHGRGVRLSLRFDVRRGRFYDQA